MRKKTKKRKGNFLARIQKTAKVRSVKTKIRKKKAELKKLSSEYKRALKTEARKLRK